MLKEIIDSKREAHISSGKFSISSIGGCWRKKYMELKGLYKQEYDERIKRIFRMGDLIHRQMVREFLEKGDAHGIRVVAAEVDIPGQKYISGRSDLIVSISKTGELVIIDVKSAGDWVLRRVKNGETEEHIKNYINQLQLYLHFFKLKRGYILFIGKHKGEIEEIEVKYNKELCERLVKEIEDFFCNYVEKDVVPEKCDGGMFGCGVCHPEEKKE